MIPDSYAVQKLFIENQWTLSIAESCTGGRIASKLTSIPGASNYFLGSVVSYSNLMKVRLLGVSNEVLKKYGAVSKEAVIAMADGVLALTNSHFSAAVSGIAGPDGGTLEKPVGTVWVAVMARRRPPEAWNFHAHGSREAILDYSANAVLTGILNYAKSFV